MDGDRSAEVPPGGAQLGAQDATLTLKHPINLSEISGAALSFSWFIEQIPCYRQGYLALDLWNGTSWIEAAKLRGNVDQEGIWHNEEIDLSPYSIGDFKLRFRGTMPSSWRANVDVVRIMG